VRAKGLSDGSLLALAREAVAAARPRGALLLVNDRPDIALLAEAAGAHLGQEDLSPRDARRVLPAGAILGLSTHGDGQVDAAATELNEEQHIHSLEPHGIDREEIHRDDAAGLCTEELSP